MLRIDNAVVGQTTSTQMVAPAPLANGRHSYQLSAVNLAGLSTGATPATIFVDTVPPKATLKLSGTSIVKTRESLRVAYTDPPPAGLPRPPPRAWPRSTSGGVTAHQGADPPHHRRPRVHARAHVHDHAHAHRPGRQHHQITHKIKVKPKPKPKRKKRHRKGKRSHAARVRAQLVIRTPGAGGP